MRRLLRFGQAAYAATLVTFLLILLFTLDRLPPVVAWHFGGSGVPNAWTSRPVYLAMLLFIGVLVPLGTVLLVTVLTRRGPHHLNLPAREHWRRPEHAAEAVRRSRRYMWWLAGILTGAAGGMHVAVLGAHRASPPHLATGGFLALFGVVLAAIILWSVGWYRLFRPSGTPPRDGSMFAVPREE